MWTGTKALLCRDSNPHLFFVSGVTEPAIYVLQYQPECSVLFASSAPPYPSVATSTSVFSAAGQFEALFPDWCATVILASFGRSSLSSAQRGQLSERIKASMMGTTKDEKKYSCDIKSSTSDTSLRRLLLRCGRGTQFDIHHSLPACSSVPQHTRLTVIHRQPAQPRQSQINVASLSA